MHPLAPVSGRHPKTLNDSGIALEGSGGDRRSAAPQRLRCQPAKRRAGRVFSTLDVEANMLQLREERDIGFVNLSTLGMTLSRAVS